MRREINPFSGVDLFAVLLYLVIVVVGCICVTAASFDESSLEPFSFSHFYIKQIMWAAFSFIVAMAVLLLDSSMFYKYANMYYFSGILLLLLTLLVGREVNGAKAWLDLGPVRLQPVELVKIATALSMAKIMSDYSFSINKGADMLKVVLLLALPLSIIVLQNDTGSGIVFGSFLFVFYREGLNKWLCLPVLLIATLFIVSFLISSELLLIISLSVCILSNMMMTRAWRAHITLIASIVLLTIALPLLSHFIFASELSLYGSLQLASLIMIPLSVSYAYRHKLQQSYILISFYLFTILFLPITNYIFTSILREHQQNRIMAFLGLVSDPLGVGYNVNQSKIAIGSGGLFGKGFLNGTQIRYGFVPERHTDFIFCALGEEWGLVGVIFLLGCFAALILRLMSMGERQIDTFGRVYCYSVASILLFHILVNVGMTIGLMPVMGIPLPFMSYGGSSLMAFTIMLFVALRLDSSVGAGTRR
ncbi:MAG: rod shape-determining protein RodA [Rikenellaceae bacterium]